jgi:methanogenic corrinoid protein MtbC1
MDTTQWNSQLLEIMIASDRKAAALLIDAILQSGIKPEQVLTTILDPVLYQIGDRWTKSDISLSQGFVAAKIAEDTLLRCSPDQNRAEGLVHKGTIILGNIEDDFHSLGRRMVASFMRALGWNVHDLGNDVPAEQFVDEAEAVNAHIIGVSAMMHTTAMNIRKVRELLDSRNLSGKIKLAVGGAVFNWRPELIKEVGGDGSSANASGADALCLQLLANLNKA